MSTFIQVNSRHRPGCLACGEGQVEAREASTLKRQLAAFVGGRVTLGGAEPTADPRLPAMIQALCARGADEVLIETDGVSSAEPGVVERLVEAGLQAVRLRLGAVETGAWDRHMGCPIHIKDAWKGARALLNGGVGLSVEVPLSRANLSQIGAIVAGVATRLSEVESVTLRPVAYDIPEAQSAHAADMRARAEREVVSISDMAQALMDAHAAADGHGLRVVFDAREGLPLCALSESPSLIEDVRRGRTRGGERPEGCHTCALLERCGGQSPTHAMLFGPWEVAPYKRVPRVLERNASPEPTVLYSPGLPSRRYGYGDKAEIRVVMPCNQDCTFCFVNREAPSPTRSILDKAVDEASAREVKAVVFTGGEPTLSPYLPALLSRARALEIPCRGIQTNALRLADKARVDALVHAGLNHAHVSLHAVDPIRYRAITGFGEPSDAAAGARHLVDAGVEVSISLVICQENFDHVTPTLRFIREVVGAVNVVLSVAREQHGLQRPWEQTLLSYRDAASALIEALEEGRRLGLDMGSAGTCSMPPCVLPDEALKRHVEEVLVQHREMSWEHPDEALGHVDANVFVAACETCSLRERCPGIQRTYIERRGSGEFRSVAMGLLS